MAQTPNIQNGLWNPWSDFDREGWQLQITVSDDGAAIIAAVIVVLLALASPVAYVTINRLVVATWETVEGIYHERHLRGGADPTDAEANEDTPLVKRPERDSYYPSIRKKWKASKTPDFAVVELSRLGWEMATHSPEYTTTNSSSSASEGVSETRRPHPQEVVYTGLKVRNIRAHKWELLVLTILCMFCLATFGLFIWGSIAAASIVTNSIALSDSPDCGFWIPDSNAKRHKNGADGFLYLQEVQAGEYAKNCYGAARGADGCNFFVSQDIPYSVKENDICPFSDELCLEGHYSAFTMSTPLIPSKVLGINVPIGYQFNRTTSCAPVKREGFVFEAGDTYDYYYGLVPGAGGRTWRAPKQSIKDFPGYDVAPFCYQEAFPYLWNPLPAFLSERYETTTLLLIQSRNNYHLKQRNDPIFPAKSQVDPPPLRDKPLYFNNDSVATVLACVDTVSVCSADGSTCWADINHPTKDLSSHVEKTGYYMLDMALRGSNVCNSILLRGGSALDAHSKLPSNLSVPISLPLATEQWKVEARNLFEGSLARIQIDLRDHIRGAAANQNGFANHLDSAYEDMCTAYKFNTVGWKNVNLWALRLLLVLVLTVYFLSSETSRFSQESETLAASLWDATVLKLLRRSFGVSEGVKISAENRMNGAVAGENERGAEPESN